MNHLDEGDILEAQEFADYKRLPKLLPLVHNIFGRLSILHAKIFGCCWFDTGDHQRFFEVNRSDCS
jgi:hypothetical protein